MLAETRSAAPAPAPAAEQDGDAAWYPVLTVVLLTVGIVPVLGWALGLILLWAAKGWRVLHKVVGTVLALAGPGMVLAGLVSFRTTGVTHSTQVVGGGDNPNPLIPPMVDAPFPWWVIAILLGAVWLAGWIWLLIAHHARR